MIEFAQPKKPTSQELARKFLHEATIETDDGFVTPMEWLYPGYKHPDKHIIHFGEPQGLDQFRATTELVTDPAVDMWNLNGRYGFTALRLEANIRRFEQIKEYLEMALDNAPHMEKLLQPMIDTFPPEGTPLAEYNAYAEGIEHGLRNLDEWLLQHWANEPEFLSSEFEPEEGEETDEMEAIDYLKGAVALQDEMSFSGPTQYAQRYVEHTPRDIDVENVDAELTYVLIEQLEYIARHGVHNDSHEKRGQAFSRVILQNAFDRISDISEAMKMDEAVVEPRLRRVAANIDKIGEVLYTLKDNTPHRGRPGQGLH